MDRLWTIHRQRQLIRQTFHLEINSGNSGCHDQKTEAAESFLRILFGNFLFPPWIQMNSEASIDHPAAFFV
jgi:hypothetical protein